MLSLVAGFGTVESELWVILFPYPSQMEELLPRLKAFMRISRKHLLYTILCSILCPIFKHKPIKSKNIWQSREKPNELICWKLPCEQPLQLSEVIGRGTYDGTN